MIIFEKTADCPFGQSAVFLQENSQGIHLCFFFFSDSVSLGSMGVVSAGVVSASVCSS